MLVVVLVLIGIAGLGYYRGWFAFSTNSKDQTPSATITVDENKFHEDEQKAKDDVQGAGGKGQVRGRQSDGQVQITAAPTLRRPYAHKIPTAGRAGNSPI
jgi:hypothetical protein